MALVCHAISKDHVTKESCAYIATSPSRKSKLSFCQFWCSQTLWQWRYDCYGQEPLKVCHHPRKFCDPRLCDSEHTTIFVCHPITQDHVTKGSCDFMGRSPSQQITTLQSLMTITIPTVRSQKDFTNLARSRNQRVMRLYE